MGMIGFMSSTARKLKGFIKREDEL